MAALTITANQVTPVAGAGIIQVTAGDTITPGMSVYKNTGNSDKYHGAFNTTKPAALCAGIALNIASDEQPLSILTQGDIILSTGSLLAVGQVYVVADENTPTATDGGIISYEDALIATSDYVTTIGVATTVAILRVNITASGAQLAS